MPSVENVGSLSAVEPVPCTQGISPALSEPLILFIHVNIFLSLPGHDASCPYKFPNRAGRPRPYEFIRQPTTVSSFG